MTDPLFDFTRMVVDDEIMLGLLGPEHVDAWWEVVDHNRVAWSETSTYANNRCATPEETLASLTREAELVQTGKRLNRGIWVDGELRGRLVVIPDRPNCSAEIGFAVDARAQGRGVAKRSAQHMVDHLTDLSYVRVWLTCLPKNTGAIRVATGLGMQLEGRMRNAKMINGRPHDKLLYALVR